MLKVQRSADSGRIMLAVSGRLAVDNVHLLLHALDTEPRDSPVVLVLGELRLVDRFGIAFLARCEADGIALRDCPPFIRRWIDSLREQEYMSGQGSTRPG
ncbi:MAG TPA: hypothetical protein VMQ61_06315 [Thermoanaerobaculia bacterium]|nr:hypothetical protein [Thermoanaerobaculia bacterium]